MRIYRNGIWICVWICLVSLIVMLLTKFFPIIPVIDFLIKHIDKINDFWFNLSLGIFCSAFVVSITYTGAYWIEKKRAIGLIKYYSVNYILELTNLLQMFLDEKGDSIQCNLGKIVDKIKHDVEVNKQVKVLLSIHDQRLLSVEGYYPILRKNEHNLEVHKLFCLLAKINGSIQYCDMTFQLHNNIAFKMEKDDLKYSDKDLIAQLKIILQIDNNDYADFIKTYKIISDRNKPISVYNTKWEDKCS